MGETGRRLVTLVEIDMDRCTRTYGVGLCAALLGTTGLVKCWNTFRTCQDKANFNKGTLTLRFGPNITGLPDEATIFPALASEPRIDASEINLSGIDARTTALGKRERVTIQLQDFTYHDTLIDPYRDERISGAAQADGIGYDVTRGTFFGKLVARNPYYLGRPLRIRYGRVGDPLSSYTTRHYVMSEWSGPDAKGHVTITAKDILDLADNAKSVAPAASRGKPAADFDASATSFALSPAGVGAEYAASGYICIGREIMTFTRSGDVMTIARGQEGTTAQAHTTRDVVQQCLAYTNIAPCDAIEDLLTAYAGVDPAFIDLPAWQDENAANAGLTLTTIITRPTGVASLIGEICQLGSMVWWDNVAQEIRYRAVRPLLPGETITDWTDDAHFLTGSPDIDRDEAKRISQMQVWHGVLDYTDFSTDGTKFRAVAVTVNADAEDDRAYGDSRIQSIYTRWYGRVGNDTAALVLAERLASRYADTPLIFSATLDVKDKTAAVNGALVRVSSRIVQDGTGLAGPTVFQINRAAEGGDRIEVKAEAFSLDGRYAYYMDDPEPDYSAASDAEKAFGAYYMDESIGVFSDGTGPYVYF